MYRFQEVDNSDQNNGASLDQGLNMVSNVSQGKQPYNPDELYFNDMDIRAWEQRTGEADGLAYGEDYGYGYPEDEGYYEEAADLAALAEYEELLFQRTLDKIRFARATGEADVSLTPEELDVYQNRMWRQRAPAARPQPRARPLSAPAIHNNLGAVGVTTSSDSSSRSPRKKNQNRSSFFGGKPKKEKSSNRTRKNSNATESIFNQAPPGFRVPGPNGQPIFTPINAYQGHNGRDARAHQPGSPLGPTSRHSSGSNDRQIPMKDSTSSGLKDTRSGPTPSRIATSRDIPGAFPSSPTSLHIPISPQLARPGSSSSRVSAHDHADIQASSGGRSRSSTLQQPPKLVPFPVVEYKHHTAEPFQYQSAGHLAQSPSQPQYARKVETAQAAMPRRVPVPVQRAGVQGLQGSYSDPNISHSGPAAPLDENVDPQTRVMGSDGDSILQSGSSHDKLGSSSGGKDGERKRKGGRRRRKS